MSAPVDRAVHELVDAWLAGPALIVGSLPPGGRDLDLLVRLAVERELARHLQDAGFERFDGGWLRFARGTVELVDLIPAAGWALPDAELDDLFRCALPIVSGGHLVRPAPHHVLLILARRLAAGGELTAKRRARLREAVREDALAFEIAGAHAAAWGVARELECLRALAEDPEVAVAPSTPRRALVLATRSLLRPLWRARPRRGGCVIALSGLDGAGKSSQARALKDTLERLGYDVAVEWTRIAWNERFWAIAVSVKSVLNQVAGLFASGEAASPGGSAVDPVGAMRERSTLLTQAWTTILALDDVRSRSRLVARHVPRGRILICDRYTLDSVVALECMFGDRHGLGLQRRLIERLSPRPLCAFLLDVSPETAWARKGEHGLPWLRTHAARYREECAAMGVRRLDGELASDELSALIAADVWRALAG